MGGHVKGGNIVAEGIKSTILRIILTILQMMPQWGLMMGDPYSGGKSSLDETGGKSTQDLQKQITELQRRLEGLEACQKEVPEVPEGTE